MFCEYCGHEVEENARFCTRCGMEITADLMDDAGKESMRVLPKGTMLNGKYRIDMVLGEGGFGITYAAWDTIIQTKVAVKEYFPSELSTRNTAAAGQMGQESYANRLTVLTGDYESRQYQKGLRRFVEEAEKLARFQKLPGTVSVYDFFYENETAYMVMEYIDGVTLEEYLKARGGRIPAAEALELMKPLMESLGEVHEAGIIHRDISPDNIMVTKDGKLKLIDFGTARFIEGNSEKSMTVILKHGYAPEEQYRSDGRQGPWTDVYALSAVIYRMVTGKVPVEASARIMGKTDITGELRACTGIPPYIIRVLQKGMAVSADRRYQDMKSFRKALSNGNRNRMILFASAGILAALFGIVFMLFFPKQVTA